MAVTDPKLAVLSPVVRACVPTLLDDVESAMTEQWPDYARFLRDNRAEVTTAAERAVLTLVSLADARPDGPDRPPGANTDALEAELFEHIGRVQWQQGHELTRLLSAYRTGAQVFWRHVSRMAVRHGVPPGTLATLAQAVFYFVDRLCTASTRGFVREQSAAAMTRLRRREELCELLLCERVQSGAVQAAAERAGWPLPSRAAIVLLDPDDPDVERRLGQLDPNHLPLHRPGAVGAVLPDLERPGHRDRLVGALRGATAVVGAAVPLDQLPDALRISQLAAGLQQAGLVRDDPMFVDEHLDTLILHQDPGLLRALRQRELAPLQAVPESSRARLCETLSTWLRLMGNRRAVAAALYVHPQTVRYRLTRLRELFGDRLDDPAARARLQLALLWGDALPDDARDRRLGPMPPPDTAHPDPGAGRGVEG